MHWIFLSANRPMPEPVTNLAHEDVSFCNSKQDFTDKVHFITKSGRRLLGCYSTMPINEDNIRIEREREGGVAEFFHGYLLDRPQSDYLGAAINDALDPKKSYYGVYSHGIVSDVDCCFASDEIGLSPIYYSADDKYVLVSNNPHLIAFYKRKLGYAIKPEPTLAIWHTIGLTIESDKTGYEGISRVRPWRYIELDYENALSMPSKERVALDGDYRDAKALSLEALRTGIRVAHSKFTSSRTAQLTGGLDSRLVAAFLMDANVASDYTFETEGSEGNADVIAAKMVASKYSLNHLVVPKPALQDNIANIDSIIKEELWANAAETSLARFKGPKKPEPPKLNGFGAVFAKSLWFASSFKVFMEKHFGKTVDFDNLAPEHIAFGKNCFGYADSDRQLLTEQAFEISLSYRDYIMNFNYQRFPDNMNYADGLSAYRWRNHNANLGSLDCNCIFLYSPIVLEASRQLTPELRQEGKLYFDMIWELDKELTAIPFENRVLNPILYEEFDLEDRNMLQGIPPVEGGIYSKTQTSLFDRLLPMLRDNLIDMLPSDVFEYIAKDALRQRLMEGTGFSKKAFPLINLYGIVKWNEMVKEFNSKVH